LLDFDVGTGDVATIYMSPNPSFDALEKSLDLRTFDLHKQTTSGLDLMKLVVGYTLPNLHRAHLQPTYLIGGYGFVVHG
jgi:hypothetical protein